MALPDIDLMKASPQYRKFIEDCVTAWMHKDNGRLEAELVTVTDGLTGNKRVVMRFSRRQHYPDWLSTSLQSMATVMLSPSSSLLESTPSPGQSDDSSCKPRSRE